MNQELLEIILMVTIALTIISGFFVFAYLSDKKAKELEENLNSK